MGLFLKTLLTIGIKILTPILKLIKTKLEREFYIYKALRKHNLIKPSSDFDKVYLETLYQLISVKKKDKNIIALFELNEVKQAFKDEIYQHNNWTFKISLDDNLNTNPKLRKLKNVNVDLEKEIEEFKQEFKKATNASRQPKEIEENDNLKKITDDINGLIDTEALRKKFKTEVEINNQILFSKSKIQPLTNHISKRAELVKSLQDKFKTSGWIAIDGSIATGKTQLSVLLSQKINSTIYWINLREIESNFLYKIFTDLSALDYDNELSIWSSKIFKKVETGSLIVLDDLPKLNYRSQEFDRFIDFVMTCEKNNISILSTSNYELPISIKEHLRKDFLFSTKIPFLDEDNIYEILLTYNVSKEKVDIFKKLIYNISSGHPLIIRLICEYLVQKNWSLSEDNLMEIFKGNYSQEFNVDIYNILSKTVPDEHTRELLYRLNIIIGTFTIEDVRVVGDSTPIISNLIERFNNTTGLWIQKRDDLNYEVSPLLKRLKSNDLGRSLEKQINYSLGKKILSKKKLSPFDAQKVISYFTAAGAYNDAGFILILALNEAINNPNPYIDLVTLYWYSLPLPKEMDLFLQMYIRTLQILLNKKESNNEFLISDLENICVTASKKGINIAPAYLLLSSHYSTKDPQKALNYLMKGNDQFDALIQNYGDKEEFNHKNNFEVLIWSAVANIDSEESTDNWLKTISNLSPAKLNSLRESPNTEFGSVFIFKSLKNTEENKPKESQNWSSLIEIFKNIQKIAKSLNLELLHANAIRFIINVYSENLGKIEDAYSYAEEYLSTVSDNGTDSFIVNDEIGRQLFYHNKNDMAAPFIKKAVNIEVSNFYTEKIDTYLVHSQILGRQNSQEALVYSIKANELTIENEFTSDILQAKVIGELAVSYSLNNEMKKAIYELEKGYQILLDSYNINSEFHVAILRYGHVLNYWHQLLSTGKPPEKNMLGGNYDPPIRGMFLSNYDTNLVEEYYFTERRFAVSILFLKSFELFGDFELSKKWAYYNISLDNSFDYNYFSTTLSTSIPYLIIDKKYIESINLQVKVIDDTNKLNDDTVNHDRIAKSKFLKSIIEERPITRIKKYDDHLIEYIIIPIMLDFIKQYSKNINELESKIKNLEIILPSLDKTLTDKAFLDSLKKIITIISNGQEIPENILKISENYKGEYDAQIKLICYLIFSIYSKDDISALKYHFAIVNRLTNSFKVMSPGTHIFIVLPFFEEFWFNRIENNNYSNMDFWYNKSKPHYEATKIENKIKCLFKIITHHLNYETSMQEDEWLDY